MRLLTNSNHFQSGHSSLELWDLTFNCSKSCFIALAMCSSISCHRFLGFNVSLLFGLVWFSSGISLYHFLYLSVACSKEESFETDEEIVPVSCSSSQTSQNWKVGKPEDCWVRRSFSCLTLNGSREAVLCWHCVFEADMRLKATALQIRSSSRFWSHWLTYDSVRLQSLMGHLDTTGLGSAQGLVHPSPA